MRKRTWIKYLIGVPAAAVLLLTAAYYYFDQEASELTDAVRQSASGSFIRLPEGIVHYELAGPAGARTVVLVHGYSVPYYIWDPTFNALVQAGYRVLRYDLYGRGYSDRPDVAYGLDLYDRQLVHLLSSLGIQEPVDLMGLSMGGSIVIGFADQHPEKVHTLSLLDPAYPTGGSPSARVRVPYLGEYVMAVHIAPSLPQSQLEDFRHPDRFPYWPGMYRDQMRYQGFRRALLSTRRSFAGLDQRTAFRRVAESRLPILLLWGEADPGFPAKVTNELLKVLPQAEHHVIRDAAHLPHYERPEMVNPILIDFLRKWELPQPVPR